MTSPLEKPVPQLPPKKTLAFRKPDHAKPALLFSPTAWAKLVFFCHLGPTEIGGFGITAPEDPLLIEEFMTVKQKNSSVSVAFDDDAVADFFEDQVDCERRPEEFARFWLHTHPGDSPLPSLTDEETFDRVFGRCDWALMFILSRTGKTYARLRFNVGPRGDVELPVQIDYQTPFAGAEHAEWLEEFKLNIHPEPEFNLGPVLADIHASCAEDPRVFPAEDPHTLESVYTYLPASPENRADEIDDTWWDADMWDELDENL